MIAYRAKKRLDLVIPKRKSHQFRFPFDAFWEVVSMGYDGRRSMGLLFHPMPLRHPLYCDNDVAPITGLRSQCFLSPPGLVAQEGGRGFTHKIPAGQKNLSADYWIPISTIGGTRWWIILSFTNPV